MAKIDLRLFGFECEAEVHATVEDSWTDGRRLVFLFGENHKDREMKRLNLLDACSLCDLGIVGCAGVEEPSEELSRWDAQTIQRLSRELFHNHTTDEGIIAYLNQQEVRYGPFEFGKTLKLLRPSLDVRCVEDLALREQMKPISDKYIAWSLSGGPHPFPDYPNTGDHPHNFLREERMIVNLLRLWDERTREAPAALMNSGLDHCRRLAERLRAQGINYIYLQNPVNAMTF